MHTLKTAHARERERERGGEGWGGRDPEGEREGSQQSQRKHARVSVRKETLHPYIILLTLSLSGSLSRTHAE